MAIKELKSITIKTALYEKTFHENEIFKVIENNDAIVITMKNGLKIHKVNKIHIITVDYEFNEPIGDLMKNYENLNYGFFL
jgi:formate-dependent phosphoribosylglycinamide formyltransferase (GAR transformylase)